METLRTCHSDELHSVSAPGVSPKDIEDVYSLSSLQQGLLFHSLYAPESGWYVEQIVMTLVGELNVATFLGCWQQMVDRHSALRTAIVWEGLQEPVQIVARQVRIPVTEQDWRGVSAEVQQKQLQEYLRVDRRRGFHFAEPPLMRLAIM